MSEVDLAWIRSFIKEFVFVRNEVPHMSHHQEQWSFLLCRFWQYSGLKHHQESRIIKYTYPTSCEHTRTLVLE